MQYFKCATLEIELDSAYYFLWCDQVHTAWQRARNVSAQVRRVIFLIFIAKRNHP